mmetsp:Transcript_82844/g.208668  ORF Transcript_82844/g.208668 Transcript_82844/m.208668 type:complete len:235 (+) Transcript_82844:1024-1728(+)
MDRARILPREKEIHRGLRRRQQQRRYGVVLAFPAVVPHELHRRARPQGLAATHLRHQRGGERAERGVHHGLHHLVGGIKHFQSLHGLLPEHTNLEADLCVQRAERPHDCREEHEVGYVPPVPSVPLGAPLVDDEGLDVRADAIQQGPGEQSAHDGADEGAEGELEGPAYGGDLLEHVQDAAHWRIEDHGHATRATHGACDALGVGHSLLVDHERRRAAAAQVVDVHPLADVAGR